MMEGSKTWATSQCLRKKWSWRGYWKETAQIIIADMSMPSLDPADFCRRLRQSDTGEDALFLAAPDQEHRAPGSDRRWCRRRADQTEERTGWWSTTTAVRMLVLRTNPSRTQGMMRSTDEKLLQDASRSSIVATGWTS